MTMIVMSLRYCLLHISSLQDSGLQEDCGNLLLVDLLLWEQNLWCRPPPLTQESSPRSQKK
jgi:hypothetical protein